MIIVMPRGHVLADRQINREENNDLIQRVLYEEVVPYVDSRYRTLADHLLDASDAFDAFLTANGIDHEYVRTEYESLWPGRLDDHTCRSGA